MKILLAGTVAVLLFSGAAMAQAPGDRTAVAETPEVNLKKHARDRDARHCLDQKTEQAIIRCANRYLYVPEVKTGT